MANLPSASVAIDEQAGAFSGNTGYIAVLGCAGQNADSVPRVFASTKALLDTNGYCQAADYIAEHIDQTGLPVIFVPMPVVTAGTSSIVVTGVTGTSVLTLSADTHGILEEVDGKLTVTKGGTIGTTGIEFDLSLDGGRTTKHVRLGAANTYTIPFVGLVIHFAAGTLVAGDVATFASTAPLFDAAGLTAARQALAAQQKPVQSWMIIGEITAALAGDVVTEAAAYEAGERFTIARVNTRDRTPGTETMSQYVSAMDTAFSSIDGQKRIDIALGRARMLSSITGWSFRRPASWHVSIREYQHDIMIPSYRKADDPLVNCDMTDGDGNVVEYDERTVGGALAARFTCLRTYANGPNGAFVALSLTRDTDNALLSRTHNMYVANLGCTIVQAETENAIGQVLVLDPDTGFGTPDSLQKIEERVNTQLEKNLLKQGIEGQRASFARWEANTNDDLRQPGSTMNGTFFLELDGTLEQIKTLTRVS